MDKANSKHEFNIKFQKLNKQNQKYIVAVQEALLYAQTNEYSKLINAIKADKNALMLLLSDNAMMRVSKVTTQNVH